MSGVLCSSSPHLRPTFTNLNSEIKTDDSPVKGSKRGKGKKEKKKTAEPAEKKKPKLEELKVLDSQTLAKQSEMLKNVFLDVFFGPIRCIQRNWRVSLTTLRTGCTVSACSEEKVEMMTIKTSQTRTE